MNSPLSDDAEARAMPPASRISPDTLAAARAVTAHHALRTAAWQALAFADGPDDDDAEATPRTPEPPAA